MPAKLTRQVFVLEDDNHYRASLVSLVRSHGMAARGFQDAETLLSKMTPDALAVILLDLRLPGMSGLEAFRRLSDLPEAHLGVIVVTGWADVPTAVNLMREGAMDVLEKPVDGDRLLQRLDGIFEDLWKRRDEDQKRNEAKTRILKLSARELQVLDFLIEGLSNRQTAERLGISHRTVDIFRLNVMKKLNVRSVVELHGLVRTARASLYSPPSPPGALSAQGSRSPRKSGEFTSPEEASSFSS